MASSDGAAGSAWGSLSGSVRRLYANRAAITASLLRFVPGSLQQQFSTPRARQSGLGIILTGLAVLILMSLFSQTKALKGLRRSTVRTFSGLSDWFFGDEDDKRDWIEELR